MFRGGLELTQAEEEALAREFERIAGLGADWTPTKENLREVLIAVKIAGDDEHRKLQREGIKAAQDKGVKIGRPSIEIPANFDKFAKAIERGELTRRFAAEVFGVSLSTIDCWRKERKEDRESTLLRGLDDSQRKKSSH